MCQDTSTGLGGAASLAYKASETKDFSLTSGLTVRTSSRTKTYLHTKPFSVNWETTMSLIKTLRISDFRIKCTWWTKSLEETSS